MRSSLASEKAKASLLKEWFSPVAVATYLGTIAGLVSSVKEFYAAATVIFALLSAILLLSNFLMYKRYTRYKRYTLIDEDLRRLAHTVKEFVLALRTTTSAIEMEELTAGAIRGVLTSAAEVFSKVSAVPCTASIMLERGGQLRTETYCYQVAPERVIKESGSLQAGEGIAGQAFSTGDVVVWGPDTRQFKTIRADTEKFYLSGISIPIRTSMKYCGLLNIDCHATGVFVKDRQEQIAHVLADQIGLIMDCRSLWKDLNGNASTSPSQTTKQHNRGSRRGPRKVP